MIRVIEGNLLKATENIIGHQVNCKGVMGSGVAKQIKRNYPTAFKEYKNFCYARTGKELLGSIQLVDCGNKFIANLFGQYDFGYFGRYTDYKALFSALEDLATIAGEFQHTVALPYKIGCDHGGGDWNIVYRELEKIFIGHNLTLYRLPENKRKNIIYSRLEKKILKYLEIVQCGNTIDAEREIERISESMFNAVYKKQITKEELETLNEIHNTGVEWEDY